MRGNASSRTAADLAAVAALLEIAEELGVSQLLDRTEPWTVDDLAEAGGLPAGGAGEFLEALLAAGLVERTGDQHRFQPRADMADLRYEAGYLTWALSANRPFIENAPDILRKPDGAPERYQRDGRRVAVHSRWVGSQGFYPKAFSTIVDCRPDRVVDLGSGAGALLVNVLCTLPDSTGVALDLSAGACAEAERAANRAGVAGRLGVVNRSIESLVDDPSPVRGADLVHAGFVLHDIASDPDLLVAVLRGCRTAAAPGARLVVTDAVPYAPDPRERMFSALFTYLHKAFMGVRLPTEEQWLEAFRAAGYTDVTCVAHQMPTGRMFVATG